MTEPLDRAELISLLETLGSEKEEEALNAARALDEKVATAGIGWSQLLRETIGTGDGSEDATEDGEAATPLDRGDMGDPENLPPDAAAKNAESLAVIEKLLRRPGISVDLREELEGYKSDIAENEFTDGDHRYIRSLSKRLSA